MEATLQLLLNSLVTGCIYALTASSLALCYATFKILNFAHGHMMMCGAYIYFTAHVLFGMSPVLSLLVSISISVPFALFIFRIFFAPYIHTNPLTGFLSTLALSIVLESLMNIMFGINVVSIAGAFSGQQSLFSEFSITPLQLWIILSSIGILALLAWLITFTTMGRKIRARYESAIYLEASGIHTHQLHAVVMCICVAMTFITGVFVGFETNIQPAMGSLLVVKGFAAMILGGLGHISGAIVSAFILSLIENFSTGLTYGEFSIPVGYKDAVTFTIILLVLLVKPQGVFSQPKRSI